MPNYDYWSEDLENEDYIEHHGILGQKWGRRRYQYEDGALTPEGRKRYSKGDGMKSTSSGSSYDHSKFENGSRVYTWMGASTADSKGRKTHTFAQPVSRPSDPDFTETKLKFWFDTSRNNINTPKTTYETISKRANDEATRNELMNEKAVAATYNMARNAINKEQEQYQKQQQEERERRRASLDAAKVERRDSSDYAKRVADTKNKIHTDTLNKKLLNDETLKHPVNAISTDSRNIIQKAADTYVSGWNTIKDTYVSGLKTIGNWFKW